MDNLGKLKEAYFDLERSRKREQESKEIAQLLVDGISVVLGEEDIYNIFKRLLYMINFAVGSDNYGVFRFGENNSLTVIHHKEMEASESFIVESCPFLEKKSKSKRVSNLFSLNDGHGVCRLFSEIGASGNFESALVVPVTCRNTRYLFLFVSCQKSFFSSYHSSLLSKFIPVFSQAIEKGDFISNVISTNKLAALGEMSAGIAHEINNPLTVLSANNDVLRKLHQMKNEKHHEKMTKIINKSEEVINRIAKIVRGMRILARDRQIVSDERIQISELVDYTMDLCSSKLATAKIGLQVDIDKKIIDKDYYLNMAQLSQVLMNLVLNSTDAIGELEEKWVKLRVMLEEGLIRFQVLDSGKGISSEEASKIFVPFYTTKDVGQGIGLGLSISRSIIEQMGGELYLSKDMENTCFCIDIPLDKVK